MSEKSICGSMPWLNRFMPERDQADVAGALAVPEQVALDPVGAGHHGQLRGGHGGAAVVVRVQADRGELAAGELAVEPLDLVGVHVRRGHLDGRRQVEDHLAAVVGLPDVGDGLADLDGELQLGGGEDLRLVLGADDRLVEEFSLCFITSSAPRTAMSLISSLLAWKTTRRNSGATRCRGG